MRNLPYPLLLDNVQQIFANEVPQTLLDFSPNIEMAPWELAEEAVFGLFRYVLARNTRKLGRDTLFEHEPEGKVVGLGPNRNRVLIYECKCRSESYVITHDDLLRYQNYIREHVATAQVFNLHLTNFVVIAPGFSGQYAAKSRALSEGGINVSLVTASAVRHLFHCVEDWVIEQVALLDLCKIFHTGLVDEAAIDREVARASSQYDLHAP